MIIPAGFAVDTLFNSVVIAVLLLGLVWIVQFIKIGVDVQLDLVAKFLVGFTIILFTFGSLIHFVVLFIQTYLQ